MEQKKNPGGGLGRWVIFFVLFLGLGTFIGYLWGGLLGALVLHLTKGKAGQRPKEGYCMERCRGRMTGLIWGTLFALIAAAMWFYGIYGIGMDKTDWQFVDDWLPYIIGWLGALGFTAAAVFEWYTSVRDAFFPTKSKLAQSIRSQLPYPDEAPPVGELFAMVDDDITANGQWFDRVIVGKEWVLGDEASLVSRISAVFGRDEIVARGSGKNRRHTRVTELYIVDDRNQVQITSLRDPKELQAAISCLQLRAPDAFFGSYKRDYTNYITRSDEERQTAEREFQRRKQQREQRVADKSESEGFILTCVDGMRTSRAGRDVLKAQFEALKILGDSFSLEPTAPVPAGDRGELLRLDCVYTHQGLSITALFRKEDGTYSPRSTNIDENGALHMMTALLTYKEVPATEGWQGN